MIREYRTSDQEEIIAVWLTTSVLAHPFVDAKMWELHTGELRNKYLPIAETWVYETDGKIVGFISLIGNYIGGLFVLPEWQGRGIGRQFVELAKSVRDNLSVGVYDKNKKAKAFYTCCGFVYESEEVQQETGEKVVNMIMSTT